MSVFGPRFKRLRTVQTALWVMLPGFILPLMAADEEFLAKSSLKISSAQENPNFASPYVKDAEKSKSPNTFFGQTLLDSGSNEDLDELAAQELAVSALSASRQDTYTINFNNVSIIEYIRFVSKISGSNFVFEENDLRFNVTIISEDPASLQDIFSALIQVLRINNLNLLEHEGNYVISRNVAVNQIPTLVSGEPGALATTPTPPLVTRVFRIKNTNVNSVASIIRPMVSLTARVSVSNETNQLIVSDIATNVDEIANLLLSLDAPHSPLEVDSYTAKHIAPKNLIDFAQPLLAPFTEGNALILVPQPEANALFIVATPTIINRALAILEDLDKPPKPNQLTTTPLQGTIFVYQLQNGSGEFVLDGLHNIIKELKIAPQPPAELLAMLESVRYVKASNSLLFVGDPETFKKVADLLTSIDSPNNSQITFYIFPLKNTDYKALDLALEQLSQQLKHGQILDHNLITAIDSRKFMKETNSFIFTGPQNALNRLQQLVPLLDQQATTGFTGQGSVYIYQLQKITEAQFNDSIKQLITRLKAIHIPDTNLIKALESFYFIKENNSIVFTGTDAALARVKDMLPLIDASNPITQQSTFVIYTPQRAHIEDFTKSLQQLADNLKTAPNPDGPLINALQSVKYLKETHAFTFNGSPDAIHRLQVLLPTLDVVPQSSQSSYFIYKVKNAKSENFLQSLDSFAVNLQNSPNPDKGLIDAIHSRRFIQETNSFIFTGSQAALDRLEKLLNDLDVTWVGSTPGLPASDHFYLYTPRNRRGDTLIKAIEEMAKNFRNSGLTDAALLHTLETAKWVASSGSIMFTGDAATIESVKLLMPTVDVPMTTQPEQIFLYRPQYLTREQIEQSLHNLVSSLDPHNPSDAQLKETIATMQWMASSGAFTFRATTPIIERLKGLLATLDLPHSDSNQIYFLYKLQYADPQATLTYLEKLASTLNGDPRYKHVHETIKNIKVIKDNNALMITGSKAGIEEVKGMIGQYDTLEHAASAQAGVFFLYRPKNLPAEQIIKDLQTLVNDLAASGNADHALQKAVKNIRFVESTQSLVISAPESTIAQIKTLLEEVDSTEARGLYQIGAKTFFIYKLQHVSVNRLMQSLKTISRDVSKGGIKDQSLATTIDSMQPITETNSILFTGTPDALKKVQDLITQFDIPSLADAQATPELPVGFYIYRPKFRPGDELIEMLCDFTLNLKQAGINSPHLYDTVNNLRWIQNTCSLLITGDAESIKKVQDLLHQFDVAGPQQAQIDPGSVGETGFLVYKLQYHQGDDIQRALRRVASDLADSHKGQKVPMADAIEALQWIPVTNSLLTSGPPEILSRIRELIQNLDIPLRQVFIEVLVLQTTVINSEQFGLSWGGRAQYLNRVAGQTGNFQQPSTNDNLIPALTPLNATTTPKPSLFPTPGGFDLGIIGDIILHKGKSFFSLGSFLQALEVDGDTSVIMNPKIIAQDSNNATMFFGFSVPFQGSLVTNTAANTTTTQSLEYRNVGHNLSITPTLGSGNIITLDINEDLSQVVGRSVQSIATSSTAIPGITTSQTTMATRVHVPDGAFVCLTGQVNESKIHTSQRIPCLGGLPLIGAAFANTGRINDRENIIIFLRPQIVKSFDEYKEITEHQEDLFRTRAHLPVLKEAYDEGLDLVKTPENE